MRPIVGRYGNSELRHRLGKRGLCLIRVAPDPRLAGLDRADKWVLSGMKVLSRVLVFRIVAAPDSATGQA